MNPERTNSIRLSSIHIPDDDLILLLYTGEQNSAHLASCPACQDRLTGLRSRRDQVEHDQLPTADLHLDRLAAQRRRIYARLSEPQPFWSSLFKPGWISAIATLLVLGGGLLVFEQNQVIPQVDTISDADLAQEVSSLSQSVEPRSAAPLKGLFE